MPGGFSKETFSERAFAVVQPKTPITGQGAFGGAFSPRSFQTGFVPLVARHGDPCGGTILATATKTFVNGIPVARLGDRVTAHGDGPHANATLVQASTTVFAEGIQVCRVGDAASCGHVITSGSPDTSAS